MDYIFDDEKLFIITSADELVSVKKALSSYPGREDEPGGTLIYQTEFHRKAAAWIVDVIENRLWRSEAESGLPSGQNYADEDVAGENLKIRRSMNVSGPGEKGFNFINFSRPHRTLKSKDYQEIQITDELLKERGLLDVIKRIADET